MFLKTPYFIEHHQWLRVQIVEKCLNENDNLSR